VTVGKPTVINAPGCTTIRHVEYLDDIYAFINFAVNPNYNVYSLNPGLTTSFPWLGNVAVAYEQYRWKKLRFRYRTRRGTATSGTIYMTTQLNSADPPFATKEEMYAYSGTRSTSAWLDMECDCMLGRSDYLKKYFVRSGPLGVTADVQLYDSGNFTFVGMADSDNLYVGELLVEYEVELYNPKSNIADVGSGFNSITTSGSIADVLAGSTSEKWGPIDSVDLGVNAIKFAQAGLYQLGIWCDNASGPITAFYLQVPPTAATSQEINSHSGPYGTITTWLLVMAANTIINIVVAGAGTYETNVKVTTAPMGLAPLLPNFAVAEMGLADAKARYGRRGITFVPAKPHLDQQVGNDHREAKREWIASMKERGLGGPGKP